MGNAPSKSIKHHKNRNHNVSEKNENKPKFSYENAANGCLPQTVLEAYRFIEGRRFLISSNIINIMPSDEIEAKRVNKQSELLTKLFKSNYYSSPIEESLKSGIRILVIGADGEYWLMNMSKTYPMSTFMGIDTSTLFSQDCLPDNCGFLEYNFLEIIPFPDNTFDFVFHCTINTKCYDSQLDNHLRELIRVVKPGGWIEIFGFETEIYNAGPATKKFIKSFRTGLRYTGFDPDIIDNLQKKLQSLNSISNIQVVEKQLYFSPKDQTLCGQGQEFLISAVNSLKAMLKITTGYSDTEFENLVHNIRNETRNPEMHTVCKRVLGRKIFGHD